MTRSENLRRQAAASRFFVPFDLAPAVNAKNVV